MNIKKEEPTHNQKSVGEVTVKVQVKANIHKAERTVNSKSSAATPPSHPILTQALAKSPHDCEHDVHIFTNPTTTLIYAILANNNDVDCCLERSIALGY